MNSNAKRAPEINLEDFERRLRAAGSAQGSVEDPLEELTRLVNTIASERPQPAEERVVELSAMRPPRAALIRPAVHDEPEFSPPPEEEAEEEYELVEAAPEAPLLRPSLAEADEEPLGTFPAFEAQAARAAAAPDSSRSLWRLKVGGVAAVALAMAAGAGYLKLRGPQMGISGAPPMIMAADGPNKVAPPNEKGVQSPSDTGALLNKDSTGAGQVKVVSNQEQPIDMGLKGDSPVAPTNDSPIIAPGAGLAIVQPAAPAATASPTATASPVAAASPAPAATPDASPNPPAAAPPAARSKGPKTVSVRPDGSVITADATAAAAPAASPTVAPVTRKIELTPSVTSQASSPTLELPAKPAKTTTRVNVGKTDTTAPTEPVSAPLQLGSINAAASAEKPQKLPTKLRPPEVAANTQPAAASGGGEWAVQLAAPRSEADAQSAIQKLQTKYAAALGDNELAVRKAEVNGDAIYRVRALNLTKADAQSLCQKLKADGGECFVARN